MNDIGDNGRYSPSATASNWANGGSDVDVVPVERSSLEGVVWKNKVSPATPAGITIYRTTLNIGLTADLGNPGLEGYGLRDGE